MIGLAVCRSTHAHFELDGLRLRERFICIYLMMGLKMEILMTTQPDPEVLASWESRIKILGRIGHCSHLMFVSVCMYVCTYGMKKLTLMYMIVC